MRRLRRDSKVILLGCFLIGWQSLRRYQRHLACNYSETLFSLQQGSSALPIRPLGTNRLPDKVGMVEFETPRRPERRFSSAGLRAQRLKVK